jgi:hypothetical protein
LLHRRVTVLALLARAPPLLQLAVTTPLPVVPLPLTMISLEELLERLLKVTMILMRTARSQADAIRHDHSRSRDSGV